MDANPLFLVLSPKVMGNGSLLSFHHFPFIYLQMVIVFLLVSFPYVRQPQLIQSFPQLGFLAVVLRMSASFLGPSMNFQLQLRSFWAEQIKKVPPIASYSSPVYTRTSSCADADSVNPPSLPGSLPQSRN